MRGIKNLSMNLGNKTIKKQEGNAGQSLKIKSKITLVMNPHQQQPRTINQEIELVGGNNKQDGQIQFENTIVINEEDEKLEKDEEIEETTKDQSNITAKSPKIEELLELDDS